MQHIKNLKHIFVSAMVCYCNALLFEEVFIFLQDNINKTKVQFLLPDEQEYQFDTSFFSCGRRKNRNDGRKINKDGKIIQS